VAHLVQSSPSSCRPERGELFWAKLDLAFFPVCASAHFESERRGFSFSTQPHVSACALDCQITLRDRIVRPVLEFLRQPLNQKFAFDFPILRRSIVRLHKMEMLNAMDSLSRFSRTTGSISEFGKHSC